ncbi:MAG: amino acid adenylation domain-containing protein [Alphaproteobacteria bacterium]
MNTTQLLAHLSSLRIGLVAVGGVLRVRAQPGALDTQTRQAIADQKTELIKLLEAREVAGDSDVVPTSRATSELSLFQERLWILHRLEPENTAYNMAVIWPGADGVDADQTAEAIARLALRHDILRATFNDAAGKPHVQLAAGPEVQILDITGLTDSEALKQMEADRRTTAHQPFDLEKAPAIRWVIYRLSQRRTAILVTAHHIAIDQWSFGILRQEFAAECLGVAEGRAPSTAVGPQYSDYAVWQRRMHASPTAAADLDWWERHLAGIPQFSTFTPDHFGENATGSSRPFCWDVELTQAVHALAQKQGVTVYMTLLAACAVALRAHSGQPDLVLGSPMGVRERAEFERVIGPFVNLLLLRLNLEDDPTFGELLVRARNAVLDAHDHGLASFETLVERLNPVRAYDRSPLFQVSVVLHDSVGGDTGEIWSGGAIQDLTWYAAEIDGCLQGSLEYRSDLYEAETIDRIALHFQAVLRAAVQDPQRKISQITLLTPAERQTVVTDFNATDAALDLAPFISQFERQVAATPDAIAVAFEGATLTYDALNRRANRLARALRSVGVAENALVGVGMKRSLDMLAALLAIQKTGAAYLPLDPAFPRERLNFMLADSAARVLLSDGSASLGAPPDVAVIDPATFDVAGLDDSNLDECVEPDAVAYVLYTSGSTGKPNGVVIDHAALSNFLGAMRIAPGLSNRDVMAAVTTISFDIAGLELYLPLTVGARIELISTETASDGLALSLQLETSGATVLQATPATWRLLIEADWRGPAGFRALCGGEPLARDLADNLLDRVEALWNLYGPTETTIWSTVGKVERGADMISVGRPIANTQVYVLDAAGQPCPIGVIGEIWIGGAGVARGYHQREALTAERFFPDPFSTHKEARFYRTGDVGHWRADGRLAHSGRVDHQVKVRGFRIELGEIETALRSHPAVRQAVVVARDAGDADVRLVAYVAYAAGGELTGSEARAHLRGILPEYMLPSVYVAVDSIPLTPNGKVDHRALPDPYKRVSSPSAYMAPATAMEQLIANIWQDLLKVDKVSVEDNFFELGGHSLLSLQVASAIHKETGWRMPPRTLFFQTLRQIAAAARRDSANAEPA